MKKNTDYIMCSECFKDYGLKSEARAIGYNDNSICPTCGHTNGKKLSHKGIQMLCERFFISGTYEKMMFGGASVLTVSEGGLYEPTIAVSDNLKYDMSLLHKQLGVGFLYAAPQMWRFGLITWLEDLTGKNKRKKECAIRKIIARMTPKTVGPETMFYRIRSNIADGILEAKMYDAPPSEYASAGRLNVVGSPVLYAAFDIETCIHECRATINDILHIATIKPLYELNLLDFTEVIADTKENTPFEMLDIAIRFLFTANSAAAYPITQALAAKVKDQGYDGIIYSSFFNQVRPKECKNIALFGRPVEESKVSIYCVNRIQLETVQYQFLLGPALP